VEHLILGVSKSAQCILKASAVLRHKLPPLEEIAKCQLRKNYTKKINDFILKIALDSEAHYAKKSKLEF